MSLTNVDVFWTIAERLSTRQIILLHISFVSECLSVCMYVCMSIMLSLCMWPAPVVLNSARDRTVVSRPHQVRTMTDLCLQESEQWTTTLIRS